MSVAVVTDSAAAIPDDLVARFGIHVVPMWLTVGGCPEREGARQIEDLLATGTVEVQTAAPTPGEFDAAVAACLDDATEVVVLTVAESMSATGEAARVGTERFGDSVHVVDTRSAAGGQALVVLAAARAVAAGASGAEVVARAREVAERVRLVATVPTLDHLVRSGRVPGIAGWAGKRLNINPMFEFRDGRVRALRPALSADAAADRMFAQVRRSGLAEARLHVAVLHAQAPAFAAGLMARIAVECAPVEAFVDAFGPVMVVHTGVGLAGVAWWWEGAGPA